jgi:hypothetical protein
MQEAKERRDGLNQNLSRGSFVEYIKRGLFLWEKQYKKVIRFPKTAWQKLQ